MANAIEVKGFDGFTTSIAILWGLTPKIHMMCGNCDFVFSKRFRTLECVDQFPKAKCPDCGTLNYVPIQKA